MLPTEVIPTNTTKSSFRDPTDTPVPPLKNQHRLEASTELGYEFSVIYAWPEGAAYVLTPRRESPGNYG